MLDYRFATSAMLPKAQGKNFAHDTIVFKIFDYRRYIAFVALKFTADDFHIARITAVLCCFRQSGHASGFYFNNFSPLFTLFHPLHNISYGLVKISYHKATSSSKWVITGSTAVDCLWQWRWISHEPLSFRAAFDAGVRDYLATLISPRNFQKFRPCSCANASIYQ